MEVDQDFTQTLLEIRAGEDGALDRLFDQVYPELKTIARGQLRRLRPGQTLDASALEYGDSGAPLFRESRRTPGSGSSTSNASWPKPPAVASRG